jgi:hypothetical protein
MLALAVLMLLICMGGAGASSVLPDVQPSPRGDLPVRARLFAFSAPESYSEGKKERENAALLL